MSPGNARTIVHGRKPIVARHRAGWRQAHLAAARGISRKRVRTWLARFAAEGEAGPADRSSRPHSSPTRTPAAVEDRIVALRSDQRRGPDWLGAELGVPARTVSRVLARRGQPRLCALDPRTGQLIRSPKATAVRYERSRPGEPVPRDVKKLGRIPAGGGWRALGRAARETTRDRTRKPGYDYVHSLVDDHSRPAYAEVLPDERGATCAGFLTRAAASFATHGIDRIERVLTDHAGAYRYSLRGVCSALGARQKFIKPHRPWQNGKVERLNRTPLTEGAYRRVFTGNDDRAAALAPWIEHYNTRRRHSALGGLPPVSRLAPT